MKILLSLTLWPCKPYCQIIFINNCCITCHCMQELVHVQKLKLGYLIPINVVQGQVIVVIRIKIILGSYLDNHDILHDLTSGF